MYEESIGIVKIFDFRFSTDLHALGCQEQNFTVFYKLFVCLSVAQILWQP